MSEIIDDFWKRNGTVQQVADVANSIGGAVSSDGFGRFGAISGLIKTIMSFFV